MVDCYIFFLHMMSNTYVYIPKGRRVGVCLWFLSYTHRYKLNGHFYKILMVFWWIDLSNYAYVFNKVLFLLLSHSYQAFRIHWIHGHILYIRWVMMFLMDIFSFSHHSRLETIFWIAALDPILRHFLLIMAQMIGLDLLGKHIYRSYNNS